VVRHLGGARRTIESRIRKQEASGPAVASLVAGNLVTLGGVLFGGLTPGTVAGTYLIEIAVVGVMLSIVPLIPSLPWENKDGDFPRWKGALYLFIFACIHTSGAALFMGGLFGGRVGDMALLQYVIDHFGSYWYAVVALALSNGLVLFRWARTQRKGKGHLDVPMAQFLRLTIAATMFIFPGMILEIFSAPTFSSPVMGSIVVLTKTGADVVMYYRFSGEGL